MGQGTAMTGTARKKALRQELRRRMLAHTDAQVAALSEAVARQVLASRVFQEATTVFGYLAFAKELSVDLILQEALRLGKTVAVPLIVSKTEFRAAVLPRLGEPALGPVRHPHGAGTVYLFGSPRPGPDPGAWRRLFGTGSPAGTRGRLL